MRREHPPRSKNDLIAESERTSRTTRSSTFITRVMPLFESNDLSVFFCFRLKLASYEAFFHPPPLSLGSLARCRIPRSHRGGHCLRTRRHVGAPPPNHSGGLLLWLCPVRNFGWLHQNVRTSQVRLALVGRHLCQAAPDHAHRKIRRWPPAPAPRPRRTRRKSVIPAARIFLTSFSSLHPFQSLLTLPQIWFLLPDICLLQATFLRSLEFQIQLDSRPSPRCCEVPAAWLVR